ncbi:hypothetical protein [Ralstonia phage RSP15]|uniref:hypothetical protein n=1 Tax=Ralstonia phage RSP15 TaxID=1785960 RepID=UPI00074D2F72|nr:hypothetical protein BH754_gp005 [Ralstonia phage RSP15]BAU39963.1 hypothetical protein [Ralstonia phage RSP15]
MPDINPTRYRMRYTGKEIDEILTSIKYKIDESSIANDWLGGFKRVASAELAKNLYEELNALKDPNNLLQLIKQIPGIEFLSDEMKRKIEYMSDKFRGVYLNHADRDDKLVTTQYIGLEIILVLDAGFGLSAWEYWDVITRQWVQIEFYDVGNEKMVSVNSSAPTTVIRIDTTKYNCVKAVILALKATEAQTSELVVAISNTKEVYYTVGPVSGNNTRLFSVDCFLTGNTLEIRITGVPGSVVKAKRVTTF